MKFLFTCSFFILCRCSFAGVILGDIDRAQNIYVLSIGVNFNEGFLENQFCISDAEMIGSYFQKSKNADRIIKYVLTGKNATRDSISNSIKSIAAHIQPSDIFIFFFAGVSLEGYAGTDSSGGKTIFFIPTLTNISLNSKRWYDWPALRPQLIDLQTLKNLLDLVQAKRQLIITEAGSGANFSEYLINTFIDKDILNAQLNDRNRVFLTTQTFGVERVEEYKYPVKFFCDYKIKTELMRGGPIAFFITHLDSMDCNIIDIFKRDKTLERKMNFIEELNNCSSPLDKSYSKIIYEKEILKIVRSVSVANEKGASRGSEMLEEENKSKPDKVPPKIKNFALLIGTDKYKASCWRPLRNPVYDVMKIDTLLRNAYGFETEVLLDTSRKAILAALKRYAKMDFDSMSQLLVFIAGHGMYDENNFGLIACSDSEDPKDDADFDTYISHSRLRDNLNAIKCRHIMVVLDVCFGGTFNQSLGNMQMLNTTDVTNINGYKKNQLSDVLLAQRLMGDKTRIYLTSGGKEYVPDGLPGHHSPFASGFIQALETKGGTDKILNCGEIRAKVIRLVPEPRGGSFDSGAFGDFVLIAK